MPAETRSPNACAQEMLAIATRDGALAFAERRANKANQDAAFWRDVATLLRLETQDDEPAGESSEPEPTPRAPLTDAQKQELFQALVDEAPSPREWAQDQMAEMSEDDMAEEYAERLLLDDEAE